MSKTKQQLADYVQKATNLAESVKRNIVHGKKYNGQITAVIDDETVLKLNEFIISANSIRDLTDELNESNTQLN